MMFATYGRDRVAYAREQMRPVVTKLVERAQEAGVLREDFRATDVPLIAYMLGAAAEYAGYVEPEVWRRYLALIIDGLRPSRDGVSELPVPALTPQEMEQSMRAHGQPGQARR
jgi:phytoene dehydrogenase-like protein